MTKLAAQIETTLYVFGQRLQRSERGQTTAEYVGIVAFVALLVVALIALAPGFAGKIQTIINAAFDKIATALG
jgi:Flp pilus assembly pilin Flp